MEKHTKKVLVAIGLVITIIVIIGLVAGLSSGRRGGHDEELSLPYQVNSSLCPKSYGERPLLLVSLDGFRADYLLRELTPSIQDVADKGVHAEYMMPSYPTVTFPNHYTIVTGLYPEAHGIIANGFYDTEFRARFGIGTSESEEGRWWGGEPIWNTITRQNKKSATYFWPGSDADINGKMPTYHVPFNASLPFEDRVLKVLEWLQLPEDKRPVFVSLYFSEPDHQGHVTGPDSDEVNEKLEHLDDIIRLLMNGLKKRNLLNCVNVIILSDHGMTATGSDKVIDMMEYIPDLLQEAYYQMSVVSRIRPKNKNEEVKLEMLRKLVCQRDEMRAYLREAVPKRLHFANNRRIDDILIELDPGFTTQFNSTWSLQGQHGYDNYYPEMNALFIAYGPDFKQSLKIKPFQNIELYNLMCHLTGVQPSDNNGTEASLNHLLKDPPPTPQLPQMTKPTTKRYPTGQQMQTYWNMSGCDKDEFSQQQWMTPLVIPPADEKNIEKKHLPWGIPLAHTKSLARDLLLLHHRDHVTVFSTLHKMPLWTSYTLQQEETDKAWIEPPMTMWTTDVRLPSTSSPSCQTFRELEESEYTMFTLFPTTVQAEQSGEMSASYLVSNAIPVQATLKELWLELMNAFPHWTESQGPLNIVLGPVFANMDNPHVKHLIDRNVSIPSDLFVILTRCSEKVTTLDLCHAMHLDTSSFILHQYQPQENCFRSARDYLIKYSATVKDVERVTHFTFFPGLSYADRVNLTLMAHPDIWPMP